MRIYIDDYDKWKALGNPFAGGYGDQPSEWVDAIEVCDRAYKRVERLVQQEQEERQRKQDTQGGKPRRRLG